MSRTIRGNKAPGLDFWSRRCFGSCVEGYGPYTKYKTKKRERSREKKIIQDILINENYDAYEGRFPGE